MAKMTGQHAALLNAIRECGIDPNLVKKIIIEIDCELPVRLHVQGYADETAIGVIKAADGDIEVIREPLKVEVTP